MNEGTKKGVQQVILLVVLLAVLGFAVVKMISASAPKKSHKASVATSRATQTDAAGKKDSSAPPSATNMPPVPRTGDKKSTSLEVSEADLRLNPNQFKVFALNPPKNPFVQSEQWYSDELNKLPGYPELKSDPYLNRTEAYLPNIPLVNSQQWEQITVDRTVDSTPYELNGLSDDGKVSTTVRLIPKTPEAGHLAWTPATGVPVSELKQPDVAKRYEKELTGPIVATKKTDDGGFVEDALGVPGDGGTHSSSDMLGESDGEALYAVGVSHYGKQASALIRYNGRTHIVREGSVLPTHYQVLTIKENGVVVVDLRDGSSHWLPLGAAPPESAKPTGKPKDA